MTNARAETLPTPVEPMPLVPRDQLRGFEHVAVRAVDVIHTTPWLKAIIQMSLHKFSTAWIRWISRFRWQFAGLEHVEAMRPPKGVILVSNHRSFFDMYVCSSALYTLSTWMGGLLFPVRARFFFSHPVGLLVNLAVSGGSMWPPVFRDDRREALNPITTGQVVHALRQPGTVVGMHPEGTRGKHDDPYDFLPTRPGLGRLIKAVDPETIILPFFILGMGSVLKEEVRILLRRPKGQEIRIRFSTPITAGDLQAMDLSDIELSELVMGRVQTEADADRTARVAAGLWPAEPAQP
jgi:1-acyl-sn-glycerol-3-phosphate acyltransferase